MGAKVLSTQFWILLRAYVNTFYWVYNTNQKLEIEDMKRVTSSFKMKAKR